jgi:CBS domain-containing protein
MKVSDLHQQRLFTADADETLDEVADRMRWHAIAALPVFDAGHLVGIITERDLTAAVADGADPAATQVADYMTPAPAVLGPDSEFAEAAKAMLELGVRHLPVVDKGHLVAVLSMRDVLDAETTATT